MEYHYLLRGYIRRNKYIDFFSHQSIVTERILWIKDALEDSEADLRFGWDKVNKRPDRTVRVAIVKINYVVFIKMFGENRAKFISAYEAYDTIDNILKNQHWEP